VPRPGGSKVGELGVCPAATKEEFDTINHARTAEDYAGSHSTLCGGRVQRTPATKTNSARTALPETSRKEEGKNFKQRA